MKTVFSVKSGTSKILEHSFAGRISILSVDMSLKYCEIQNFALNLTAFRILNTTLQNFLAVKSSKPQLKHCGSLTQLAYT